MRINPISTYSSNYQKNNQNNLKTNFKADVRIVPKTFHNNEIPDEHLDIIENIFKSIDGKFKNVGSDNILILLEPRTNGETKSRKIKSNIMVKGMFKDAERAQKEMLEYIEKNQLEDKYGYIKELAKNGSKLKDYLSDLFIRCNSVVRFEDIVVNNKVNKINVPTQKMVERTIYEFIEGMQKFIPDKEDITKEYKFVNKSKNEDYESLQFPIV